MKICGHTDEEKSCQDTGLDFAFRTIENQEKTKKLLEERNGESDRRGDGSSSFIVKKTRISVHLQLQLDSLRTKTSYRSMGTTGDPVPVGQRDVPVNYFTG